MASSRKPQPNSVGACAIEVLRGAVHRGARVCVGLSGGLDSVVLLDVLCREAAALGLRLSAVHVHHGISRYADDWAQFCERACRRRGVPLRIERIDISPWRQAHGIESAARIARYRVFALLDVDAVLLAHHLDDQAETVLLQLLRGAGTSGLAGMGAERSGWSGMIAPGQALPVRVPKIVRPLLGVTRAAIAAHAKRRRLRWVDDDTNDDERFARNRLRQRLMPLLPALQPAAIANLARSARHLAAADRLLGDLGREDLVRLRTQVGLSVPALLALGLERGQNALRTWLRAAGAPALETDQLDELWRQLASTSGRRALRFAWRNWAIERYRDEIALQQPGTVREVRNAAQPLATFATYWQGERPWGIDRLGGVLSFRRVLGSGIADRYVQVGALEVRVRQGGERIRLGPQVGHRTLKNLFQENAVPPGARAHWPLLFVAGQLAYIPGLGGAHGYLAGARQRGWEIGWTFTAGPYQHPRDPADNPVEMAKTRAKIKS